MKLRYSFRPLVIGLLGLVLPLEASTGAQAKYVRSADSHSFTVFMKEGGWCWFQDPRAIVQDGKLVLGALRGNDSGAASVGVFDLGQMKSVGSTVLHDAFNRDDHNVPVFYQRPDGSLLAMYARHSKDFRHHYRISKPNNPIEWGEERIFEHDYPTAGKVTYMNLLPLADEGKLYNFYRGIEFNPCFVTSTDDGETWSNPTHFIKSELEGRHRPYVRYVGNGTDTIHFSFTDGHPRNFSNSVYFAAFRKGKFYRSDGSLIKDLKADGPLRPSEADRVFQGGKGGDPGGPVHEDQRGWTSSIELDADGHPHIGYSVHLTNEDHRYRLASWNGKRWIDREVARAGHCLYERESSYTGLITLDPGDPSTVVISTNVDPTSGKDSGARHEIHRATIGADDDIGSIEWKAVTKDSPVRNLRPVIVRGNGYRVITWLRGDFRTYTDYQMDVVGVVEKLK
ncbi:BNR-4 repeat-containing protein [Haloferula sp.]|uniref:BNR-4 repeat-containing protein n=1 Tax=Haloferula sp. TaxID=2497595 RepID=UPI00329F6826